MAFCCSPPPVLASGAVLRPGRTNHQAAVRPRSPASPSMPKGVLRTKMYTDPGGRMWRERIAAARASLDPKVTAASNLRQGLVEPAGAGDSTARGF